MTNQVARIYQNNQAYQQSTEQAIQDSLDRYDPFRQDRQEIGEVPFYSTGARSRVRVGGLAVGIAQGIRWTVTHNSSPVFTVDSIQPWDIDVGTQRVTAELRQIIDPTAGPEADGTFAIAAAAVHQPFVEIQVLDNTGTQLFFSRGMFTEVTGDVSIGNFSTWQARFMGVTYQHYVTQQFQPYSGMAGLAGTVISGLQDLSSDLTGGVL